MILRNMKPKKRYSMKTRGEKIVDVILLIVFALITFGFLYPFVYILALSFNDAADAVKGGIYFFPRKFSIESYKAVFKNDQLLNAYGITILRTLIGTFTSVLATGMFGYGLSKSKLMFRKVYFNLALATMFFSGGLIPMVILIKNLHLTNNFLVYIIPSLISVFNMLVMKSFFQSLPPSLEEAATVDGCNDVQCFFRIVIPSSMPVISTIALFNAVAQWNAWFDAYLYITDQKLIPLQTLLQRIINQNEASQTMTALGMDAAMQSMAITPYSIQLATMVVSIGPIVLIYPFFQKYFVKGLMIGAVKE